jgi:hypothetical protein
MNVIITDILVEGHITLVGHDATNRFLVSNVLLRSLAASDIRRSILKE